MEVNTRLVFTVLCGGESTRMGSDKSLMQWHAELEQREYCWKLMQEFQQKNKVSVCFSINKQQAGDSYYDDKQVVVDKYEAHGPMGAIVSVMKDYREYACLVLACDMPCMTLARLQTLLEIRNANNYDVCVYELDGILQPLCALYEASMLNVFQQALHSGRAGLQRAIRSVRFATTQANNHEFLNINTQGELYETCHR